MKPSMTVITCLIAALAATMTSVAARADVCQKDAPDSRIRVVKLKDGDLAFVEGRGPSLHAVGPEAEFSAEELEKKRTEAQAIVSEVDSNNTTEGVLALFTIFALAGHSDARVLAATHDGMHAPDDSNYRAKYPHAKEIADALNVWKVYPTDVCTYVDSLDAYKAELAKALDEVKAARAAASETPVDVRKLVEATEPKIVPAAPARGHAPRSPATRASAAS